MSNSEKPPLPNPAPLARLIIATLLTGCAGVSRDCSSCNASSFGSDWVVVQYRADGSPLNCWELRNTPISNEQGTDGIFWQDPQGAPRPHLRLVQPRTGHRQPMGGGRAHDRCRRRPVQERRLPREGWWTVTEPRSPSESSESDVALVAELRQFHHYAAAKRLKELLGQVPDVDSTPSAVSNVKPTNPGQNERWCSCDAIGGKHIVRLSPGCLSRAALTCEACALAATDPMGLFWCEEHNTSRKPSNAMILCEGCGFHVERSDIRQHDGDAPIVEDTCLQCLGCQTIPKLRESYRRGFNAGLDACAASVVRIVRDSNLRRRPES